MARVFRIGQYDVRPRLVATLTFAALPVDATADEIAARDQALTDLTAALTAGDPVLLTVKHKGSSTYTVTDGECTILDPAARRIAYSFTDGQTDLPGQHDGEATVLYGGTARMTHPLLEKIPIYVDAAVKQDPTP